MYLFLRMRTMEFHRESRPLLDGPRRDGNGNRRLPVHESRRILRTNPTERMHRQLLVAQRERRGQPGNVIARYLGHHAWQ